MKITHWLASGSLFLAIGCSASINTAASDASADAASEITAEAAKAKAAAIIPDGEAGKVEREEKSGEDPRWLVEVKMKNGAVLVVELLAKDGALAEIKSEAAPFDGYDVTARQGVLLYSAAKAKALESKAGSIEAWEFDNLKTIWEFYVRDVNSRLWEIKMNAVDGSSLVVEEKAARD